MTGRNTYAPFLVSAIILWLLLLVTYPFYNCYIDPDGVAYLTISARYAAGDFARAVNGYWSPWSCWLTALLIKAHLAPIPASVLVNAAGATGFLAISQVLFVRLGLQHLLQWCLGLALSVFLCFAVYYQSFDDIWEAFFLLLSLRIMLSGSFMLRPSLWVAAGLVGALAYFAKAYAFPFFILNACCIVFMRSGGNRLAWLKVTSTIVAVMVLCSIPWIIALHSKYGTWSTSTAGPLNMSWYLVGHPYYKPGIGPLLPPVYPDSPYWWEDPYYVNGPAPHFWHSWQLAGTQVLRIGLNLVKLLVSTIQLSVFFPIVTLAAIQSFFSRRWQGLFTGQHRIVALSFLLFPLGYLLVNYESRYLWYILPLGMVLGGIILQRRATFYRSARMAVVFSASFIVFALYTMYGLFNAGKSELRLGQSLRTAGLKGSFALYAPRPLPTQVVARIAYFSGLSLFHSWQPDTDLSAIANECARYNVDYLIIYSQRPPQVYQADSLRDAVGRPLLLPGLYKSVEDGVHKLYIYRINK